MRLTLGVVLLLVHLVADGILDSGGTIYLAKLVYIQSNGKVKGQMDRTECRWEHYHLSQPAYWSPWM